MRNLKKVLALVLALVMAMSLVTIANASDFADADDITYEEAVEVLTALKVIEGVGNNTFNPTGNVTRAQMAKMITIVALGDVDPSAFLGTATDLTDIDGHWAEAYIKYCYSQGIISGKGNGIFDPNANVTAAEASKMLLVAIGYNSDVQGYTGSQWTINVARDAQIKGFYKDLAVPSAQDLTRDQAAQLIWNAAQAQTVRQSKSQNTETGVVTITYVDETYASGDGTLPESLLHKTFEAVVEYGYMTDIDYDADKGEYTYDIADDASFGAADIAGSVAFDDANVDTLTTTLDVADLYGQQVKVVYKDNAKDEYPVYGIYANKSEVLLSGTIGDLPDDLLDTDTSMKVDDTIYRFNTPAGNTAANVTIYDYNDMTDTVAGIDGLEAKITANNVEKEWSFDLIDNDGDGKANCVVVYPFTVAKVTYVGTDSFNTAANAEMGVAIATGIDLETVNTYEGIAKDDYVMIVDGTNAVDGKDTYTKIDEIVEGKVTATKAGGVEVDGEWYNTITTAFDLGDTHKFVIVNGYVCAYDVVTIGANIDEYAVVLSASKGEGVYNHRVKLLFSDGSTEIVDSDIDYSRTGTNRVQDLVTFEIEDGEYVLTAAEVNGGDADKAGFDVILNEAGTYTYAAGGKSTLCGQYIADDAVIFTKTQTTGKFDVITGAALKKYASDSITDVFNAYADKAANGFTNVVLAYVEVADSVDVKTSLYGYVTSGLTTTKNEDNETVSRLDMWTADGQLTGILADENLAGKVAKGSVVTYTENDDGSYAIDVASVSRAAILAYNEANNMVRFTNGTLVAGAGDVDLEVTSETLILGINSDTVKGVEGVEITTAVETAIDDLYQANAYYYTTGGNELDVIVIDVYADLPVMPGAMEVDATDEDALKDALASSPDVTVDASKMTEAASVTVAEDSKLTITASPAAADKALTVTLSDGAELVLPEDATNITVNVVDGATVVVNGETLVGEGGIFEVTDPAARAVSSVVLSFDANGVMTVTATNTNLTMNKAYECVVALEGTSELTYGAKTYSDCTVIVPAEGDAVKVAALAADAAELGADIAGDNDADTWNGIQNVISYGLTQTFGFTEDGVPCIYLSGELNKVFDKKSSLTEADKTGLAPMVGSVTDFNGIISSINSNSAYEGKDDEKMTADDSMALVYVKVDTSKKFAMVKTNADGDAAWATGRGMGTTQKTWNDGAIVVDISGLTF